MKDNFVVFPIIIEPVFDDGKKHYLITIPDLDRMTQAYSIPEAIEMGQDLIGAIALVKKLPKSNVNLPKVDKPKIATLVTVNISKYKRENDDRVVKKTLTIPNYLNELGKKDKINFSQVLTDALKQKLNA